MGFVVFAFLVLCAGTVIGGGGMYLGGKWQQLQSKRWEKRLLRGLEDAEHQEAVRVAAKELEQEMDEW